MAWMWVRWVGRWILYGLWWLGYWIAMALLTFVALFFLLPGGVDWIVRSAIAISVASFIVVWQIRRNLTEYREPGADGCAASEEERWGGNVFVGLFSGPVISWLGAYAASALFRRFGIEPRDSEAMPIVLVSGAWLGAFTWEVLGGDRSRQETARILLVGGALSLAGLLTASIVLSGGAGAIAPLAAALVVPIVWSIVLLAASAIMAFKPPHPMWRMIEAESVRLFAQLSVGAQEEGSFGAGMLKGNRLEVQAVRPGSLRIDAIDTRADFQGEGAFALIPCDHFISNGVRQIEISDVMNEYEEAEAAPWISHVTSRMGLPEAISADVLFYEDPLYNFKRIAESGWEPHIAVYEREHYDASTTQRVYIDKSRGVPVRISMIFQAPGGQASEIMRAEFDGWEFDRPIDGSVFDPARPTSMSPREPEPAWYDESIVPGMAPAPLEATDLEGRPIRLSDYTGKVVLLDFWAVWCGPCTAEIPALQEAYAQYRSRGFEVISISFDDEDGLERLRDFIRKRGIEWPVICDGKGFRTPLAEPYGINAVPFTLLIGRNGKIARVNLHGEELITAIRELVS